MFFAQPKIQRIAKHLKSLLDRQYQIHLRLYTYSVRKPKQQLHDENNNCVINLPDFGQKNMATTSPIFRPKPFFLPLPRIVTFDDPYKVKNSEEDCIYAHTNLKIATIIHDELEKKEPNYQVVLEKAQEILKGDTWHHPQGYTLFHSSLISTISILWTPITLFIGIICIIPWFVGKSEYCGSPHFFLDTLIDCISNITLLLSAIAFPVAMVYSAYMTDSYDPFTKGESIRCLEGIIALAEAQLKLQTNAAAIDIPNNEALPA